MEYILIQSNDSHDLLAVLIHLTLTIDYKLDFFLAGLRL